MRTVSLRWRAIALIALITSAGCVGSPDIPELADAADDPVTLDTGVEDMALISLGVAPIELALGVGGTAKLTATGIRGDRTTVDLTRLVQWQIMSPSVATVSNTMGSEGTVTSVGVGEAWVSVQFGSVMSPPASIVVTDAAVVALEIDNSDLSIGVGETGSLGVTAAMDNGATIDATTQVNWVVQDDTIVQVRDGLVEGLKVGTTQIAAELSGQASEPVTIDVVDNAIPDLAIESVDGVVDAGVMLLTVHLANLGTGAAEGFWVDVFVDPIVAPAAGDIGDTYAWIDTLAGGADQILDFELVVSGGSHDVAVFADTNDTEVESSEQNNLHNATIHPAPQGADLIIDTVDWFADETTVFLDVLVANVGDTSSEPAFIDYFLDQSQAPVVFDFGDGYDTIEALAPQESTWVTWMIPAVCDPDCTSWILVDSLDEVDEANEANNAHGPSILVSPIPNDTGWW